MALRALIAEDDSDIRAMLKLSLGIEGIEVLTAGDGADAMAKLAVEKVDVLVLDVMMPVMNGYEVLERLRSADLDISRTPVIMVTAKADDEDIWQGWTAGVDSYITKPVDVDLLLEEITRVTSAGVAA